jgi:shikimate kinase
VQRHVTLVGLMGVGKTTVGRRLGRELDRPFADIDEAVELRAGRTIRRIFSDDGEAAFRTLERAMLRELHATRAPLVISAGGGAVTDADNRAVLATTAFVVWLRASPAFLASRVSAQHRPLLADDAEATLARLEAERRVAYESVADATVDVEPFHRAGERPKRALAEHIAGLVHGASQVSA